MYESTHPSVIDRLFTGLLKSSVTCTHCEKTSVTHSPFMTMSLAFEATLDACIRGFTREEQIDGQGERYKCGGCQKKTRAWIKVEVARRPKIMVFHIKRF